MSDCIPVVFVFEHRGGTTAATSAAAVVSPTLNSSQYPSRRDGGDTSMAMDQNTRTCNPFLKWFVWDAPNLIMDYASFVIQISSTAISAA